MRNRLLGKQFSIPRNSHWNFLTRGIWDGGVHKNLPKLKSARATVKVILQMESDSGESTSSPRRPWILSSSALQLHGVDEWRVGCKVIYRRLTRIQVGQLRVGTGMLDFVCQSTPSCHQMVLLG